MPALSPRTDHREAEEPASPGSLGATRPAGSIRTVTVSPGLNRSESWASGPPGTLAPSADARA